MIKRAISLTTLFLSLTIGLQAQNTKNTESLSLDFNNDFYSFLYIDELLNLTRETHYLTLNWVHIYKIPDTKDKLRLVQIHNEDIPLLINKLDIISNSWTAKEVKQYNEIELTLSDLLSIQNSLVSTKN